MYYGRAGSVWLEPTGGWAAAAAPTYCDYCTRQHAEGRTDCVGCGAPRTAPRLPLAAPSPWRNIDLRGEQGSADSGDRTGAEFIAARGTGR